MAQAAPDRNQQQRRIRLTVAALLVLVVGLYALAFLRHHA
jgi:cytochrome b561